MRDGEDPYPENFVALWIGRVLYHDLPPVVFTVAYALFGAAVRWAGCRYRPRAGG